MTSIDDIKARLDILDVAGGYLELQRSGKNWKAVCPFHPDHHPSLVVFPGSQSWKCFGCGKGGDIFDLVQQAEALDFSAALRVLADKAGVALEPLSPEAQKQADLRRERQEIFAAAAAFFQERLWSPAGKTALAYARGRGWTDEILKEAGTGCFGQDWNALRGHLRQAGVDLEAPPAVALLGFQGDVAGWAQAAGLAPPAAWAAGGKIPAMPPDLLVYPHVLRGRVEYLAGRGLGQKQHWNPPSELAGPRQVYFNARWWGPPPSGEDRGDAPCAYLIVEGQGDALTLAQWDAPAVALAGCTLAAAPGASLPEALGSEFNRAAQARLANARFAKAPLRVAVALDRDRAGEQGSEALAEALLQAGLSAAQICVLRWPEHDANQWLQSGADAEQLAALLAAAPTWVDELLARASHDAALPAREGALPRLFSALADLDEFQLPRFRTKVCEQLGLPRGEFRDLLRASRRAAEAQRQAAAQAEDEPERFLVVDGRICELVRKASGPAAPIPLCNFHVWIEQDILRDDGQRQERLFLLRGELAGQPLPLVRVSALEFPKMDWVLQKYGSQAIIEPGRQTCDKLRAAIQTLSPPKAARTVYTHTGWLVQEGGRSFLSASGALGEAEMEVDLDPDLALYRLPPTPQDPAQAMRLSLSLLSLAPPRVVYPLWGAVWLAPLRDLLKPAFALWVYGATGALKSSLTALFLNHYGPRFDEKHLPANFTDTANRLEQKAFLAKDVLLVIDDFAPQKDRRSHDEYLRTAQRIVRSAGNLDGRGRLKSDSSAQKTYFPRGLLAITGEDLPQSESLLARLFLVELSRGEVDLARLTDLQGQRRRLPHALSAYLAWLAESWEGQSQTLPARFEDFRQQAYRADMHLRLPDAVAALRCGVELGLRFAVSLGVLGGPEFEAHMEQAGQALLECAGATHAHIQNEKPEEMFLNTFRELLSQGKICLHDREGGSPPIGGQDERAEKIGWYDEQHLYLLPEVAYTRISRQHREQGGQFPVSEVTLRKMLKEAGVLVPGEGRLTGTVWTEGRVQRVVVLLRAVLLER